MDKWISAVHKSALAARSIPVAVRYALTVLFVAATVVLKFAWVGDGSDRDPYLIFIPVVFACGTLFDRGNGFLATVLSAAACVFYFIDPVHSLAMKNSADQGAMILFVVIGFAISSVVEALHAGLVALATERTNSRTGHATTSPMS
jgi:K+-sensing histidine kinase KdpD